MTRITLPGALPLLLMTLACGGTGAGEVAKEPSSAPPGSATAIPADQEAAWLARGAAIVAPYRKDLKGALVAAMADGPEAAISACRLEVPRLARHLAVDGIDIGRTSHRLRNPDNAPRDWVRPLLAAYTVETGERDPQVTLLADGRIGYVEPISIKPACLLCHGTGIPAPAAQRIAELYPQDQATGFAVDEFRGLFWVEFPAGP
jgi:hypothetical protein